jgi:hypothetical protein
LNAFAHAGVLVVQIDNDANPFFVIFRVHLRQLLGVGPVQDEWLLDAVEIGEHATLGGAVFVL